MPLPVEYRRSADRELRDAKERYRESRGTEKKFVARVNDAINLIQSNPLGYREVFPGVRRIVVKRYPYTLFYIVEPTRLVVIGCWHHSQDSANWPQV